MPTSSATNLPLVKRFKSPTLTGDPPYKRHSVFYFGSQAEYIDHLTPSQAAEIAGTLGYYDPPKNGGNRRGRAYFFRDPNGQLPVTATLYHEVSHQLLFETAGPNAYTKNVGNYWVFEGLGTYFETVSPQPDGSLEVGGLTGPRIEAAMKSLVDDKQSIPLAEFVALDQNAFNNKSQIYLHYQQAMALAVFLEQWHDGTYRDAFLDYVRDAYRGRIKRGTGRSLQVGWGNRTPTLDGQFLAFLKNGRDRLRAIRLPWLAPRRGTRSGPSPGSKVGRNRPRPAIIRQPQSERNDRLFARRAHYSFTDVRDQCHEPCTLDGCARRPLKRRTTSTSLAGKHLVLVGAQLLEQTDVLVIDIGRVGGNRPGCKTGSDSFGCVQTSSAAYT